MSAREQFRLSPAAAAWGLVSLLASGVPATAQESGNEITWPRKQFDPSPARENTRAQELVLPMPCGGGHSLSGQTAAAHLQ